jgi:hypothetical protein
MKWTITTTADPRTYNSGPSRMTHTIEATTELNAREMAYTTHRLAVCPSSAPKITIEAVQ